MTPRTTQPLGEVNVAGQMAGVNESVYAPAICVPGKKNKLLIFKTPHWQLIDSQFSIVLLLNTWLFLSQRNAI